MLFSNLKKWNTDTYYNVDEPWKHYTKWRTNYCTVPFMCNIQNRPIYGDKKTAGSLLRREWESLLRGIKVSFRGKENVDLMMVLQPC